MRRGPAPLKKGEWVLVAAPTPEPTLAKISAAPRLSTPALVTLYRRDVVGGWRDAGEQRPVPVAAITRATVEEHDRSPDRLGPVVLLVGSTARSFAAARSGVLTPGRQPLHKLRQRSLRRLLEGEHARTDASRKVLAELNAPALLNVKQMYLGIINAPWPASVRNFAWDMAAGVMPCGRSVKGSGGSHCLVCAQQAHAPLDSVAHFAQCSCLAELRRWFATIWRRMGWIGEPSFAHFMICGHAPRCGDFVAATAIRGALIATARWIRNSVILNGEVKPPQAARQYAAYRLRHHVLLDYQCASAADRGVGPTSRWRPATVAAFVTRWTEVCTLANGLLSFHAIIAVAG